jgi:rhodanese-related sulfurtransferase
VRRRLIPARHPARRKLACSWRRTRSRAHSRPATWQPRSAAALSDPAAAIVTYSTDAHCTRGPELAGRLRDLGYRDVRTYDGGIEDWIAAGLPVERPRTS